MGIYSYTDVNARGGGGGGGGGGSSHYHRGGGNLTIIDILILIVVLIVLLFYFFSYKKKIRINFINKAINDIEKSSNIQFNINLLKDISKDIFLRYQKAWSEKNIESVKDVFTNAFYNKSTSLMDVDLKGKKNIIKDINIIELNPIYIGENQSMFTIEIKASMIDYTIDESTGKFLYSTMNFDNKAGYVSSKSYENKATNEPSEFTEYYSFVKKDNKWMLYEIESVYYEINFKIKSMFIFLTVLFFIILTIVSNI